MTSREVCFLPQPEAALASQMQLDDDQSRDTVVGHVSDSCIACDELDGEELHKKFKFDGMMMDDNHQEAELDLALDLELKPEKILKQSCEQEHELDQDCDQDLDADLHANFDLADVQEHEQEPLPELEDFAACEHQRKDQVLRQEADVENEEDGADEDEEDQIEGEDDEEEGGDDEDEDDEEETSFESLVISGKDIDVGQIDDVCVSGDASAHCSDADFWSEMADLEESRGRVVAQASSLLSAEKEHNAHPPRCRPVEDGALGALADAFPAKLAEALEQQDDVVAKLRAEVAFLKVTEGLQLELEAIKRQAAAAVAGRSCISARGVTTNAGLGYKGAAAKPATLVPVPMVRSGGIGTLGKRPRAAHLRRKLSKGARPVQVMDTITEKEQPPLRELSPEAKEAHRRSKLLSELRSVAKSLKATSAESAPSTFPAREGLGSLPPAPVSVPRRTVSPSAKTSLVVDTATEMDGPSRSPSPVSTSLRPPRANPRSSPRSSPGASPSSSPRTSPGPGARASPKTSPRSSPRTSPRTSPQSSPTRGGAVPGPRIQSGFFLQHGSASMAPTESGQTSRGRSSVHSSSCTELPASRRSQGGLTSQGDSGARGRDEQSSPPRPPSNQIASSAKAPPASERLGSPRRSSPTRAVPLVRPPWGSRPVDAASSRGGTPRSRVPLVNPAIDENSGTPRRGAVVPSGAPDSARKTENRQSQRRCTASSSPVRGSTPQRQEVQEVAPTIPTSRQTHVVPPATPMLETSMLSLDIGTSYKLMQVPVEVVSTPPNLPPACEQHSLVRSIVSARSQTPPVGPSIRSPPTLVVPSIHSSSVQNIRSPTPPATPSFTPVQLPVRVSVVQPAASPPNPGRPPLPRSSSDFNSSGVSEFCIHTPSPPAVGFHNPPRCVSATMAPVTTSLTGTSRTVSSPSLSRLPIPRIGRPGSDVASVDLHSSNGVATPPVGGSRGSSPHSTPPVAFQPKHLLVPRPAASASSSSLHKAQDESTSVVVETRSWLRPECAASLIVSN